MKRESRVGIGALSAAEADLVDEICDRFEAALGQGVCALLENYLEGVGEPVFSALLLELLITELEQRQARGPRPAIEDYRKRFPGRDELIAMAFQQASRSRRVPERPGDRTEGDPGNGLGPETSTAPGSNEDDTHTQVYRDCDKPGANAGSDRGGGTDTSVVSDSGDSARAVPIDLLSDFQVLEEIGRGGMGVVYKAVQRNLNRKVALKVLPLAFASDPIRLARFRNEASIAANLQSARIVPVFDIKEAGGTLILIMPYVEGRDLAKILAERKKGLRLGDSSGSGLRHSSTAEREHLAAMLPLLDQVIAAVAAIHEAGVVHRDIKPSNILVDSRGDIQLSDFGLARLGREAVITSAGAGLGTPGYMSPEQWEGREDVDLRTDVFGLGVTIYQALTLDLPYGKGRVSEGDRLPEHPGRKHPRVPGDLGAVILKALEPDRTLRYASANELQQDWRRAREGGVPLAARRRPLRQLSRFVRRHARTLMTAMALAVVLAFVGIALARLLTPPLPGEIPRTVELVTDPPHARFILVRRDDETGEPDPSRIIRPAEGTVTPAQLEEVPPGDYLVVVVWTRDLFHEVNRHVPTVEEVTPRRFHHELSRLHSGAVQLPKIVAPPPTVLDGMTRFDPRPLPQGRRPELVPFQTDRELPAYYLDQHEVTVGDYAKFAKRFREHLAKQGVTMQDDDAVALVSCDAAEEYLEMQGKRLPAEAEYDFAATGGGTRPFPGADAAPYLERTSWPVGRAGEPDFDRTTDNPPVFGLYSNVAEWTGTRFYIPPGPARDSLSAPLNRLRVVRGAPPSVFRGVPERNDLSRGAGAETRAMLRRDINWLRTVGFRGARSVAPRFFPDSNLPPSR